MAKNVAKLPLPKQLFIDVGTYDFDSLSLPAYFTPEAIIDQEDNLENIYSVATYELKGTAKRYKLYTTIVEIKGKNSK